MNYIHNLQLLACLMVYAPSAHAIMVKFGTKGGPIVPPTPEPTLPTPQPYRAPAPVWEERANDAPDPNAHWRPQLFVPQTRYTNVIYNVQPTQAPLSSAQRFVNSYIPIQKSAEPVRDEPPKNYFTPAQILSSQSLPGFGIRYFVPTYFDDPRKYAYKQDDAQQNHITSNDVNEYNRDSSSDAQWKYEKDLARRHTRNTPERSVVHVYQWPAYVPPRHR